MNLSEKLAEHKPRIRVVAMGDSIQTRFGHIVSCGRAVSPDERALIKGPTSRKAVITAGLQMRKGTWTSRDGAVEMLCHALGATAPDGRQFVHGWFWSRKYTGHIFPIPI